MVLQKVARASLSLGQALPTLKLHALDATRSSYNDTFTVWVTYERTAPTEESVNFEPGQDIVIPLKENQGRAIVSLVPHGIQTPYIIPGQIVVDPNEGSQERSFVILKKRGEVEPEVVGSQWMAQLATGLAIGVAAFGATYGIYRYMRRDNG